MIYLLCPSFYPFQEAITEEISYSPSREPRGFFFAQKRKKLTEKVMEATEKVETLDGE
jgi:hypothetical protein